MLCYSTKKSIVKTEKKGHFPSMCVPARKLHKGDTSKSENKEKKYTRIRMIHYHLNIIQARYTPVLSIVFKYSNNLVIFRCYVCLVAALHRLYQNMYFQRLETLYTRRYVPLILIGNAHYNGCSLILYSFGVYPCKPTKEQH